MSKFADRDECLDSPCDGNATCQNTPGSFVCTCKEGFTGSGLECQGMVHNNMTAIMFDMNIVSHRY